MSNVLSVARKELRAFFRSPIAIIFIGVYLSFTLLTFFAVEQFFARNIADLRPLFAWAPVLLIFLCSALTMRQWSEEQKLGTLEVLFTLPVEIHQLVAGKFLASLGLVVIALGLTLPVPMVVSTLGDLDWGPVLGGYLGAILLAGAYLSVGLFISALTDNQIVALILSAVACALLWFIGSDTLTQYVGNAQAEILTALGTGSRFESVRRGVLDIRDLVYYGSLIATFLTLNAVVLSAKGWSDGARTRGRRFNARTTAALVAVNALILNLVLAPVTALRVDLTERGEYSISEVTKDLVRSLPEPLLIRGYFSEKTHPLLAPMVPRIRDMIEEYGIIGNAVRTEYVDPRQDKDVEKEANQLFGIKPFPFRIASARDQAVVNSYFSILVKYGDEYEVLNFDDLIEVQGTSAQNVEVKLRNLEYDLTRSIKKTAFGFQTLDAVFVKLASAARATAFVTPADKLPENFKEMPKRMEAVLEGLKADAKGKFEYSIENPDQSQTWSRQKLFETYGIKPFAVSLLSSDTFYLHIVMDVDGKKAGMFFPEAAEEADIKKEIVSVLERATPGFLKTVGLAKPATPDYSQLPPQLRQQMPPPPPDVTRALQDQLSEGYTVQDVTLDDGKVPGEVDVLLVQAPSNYDAKKAFAIDQHLMRGGTVVVFGGRRELDLQASGRQGLTLKSVSTGLEDLLSSYGLRIEDELVMDLQSGDIVQVVPRDLGGGIVVQERIASAYPFFSDVRASGMAKDSPMLAGLNNVIVPWASPIVVTPVSAEGEGPKLEYTELLRTSDRAWSRSGADIKADFRSHPELGYAVSSDTAEKVLAVAVSGEFVSAYKGKGPPEGVSSSVIERSPASARLVVIASSSFASDVMLQLTQQAQANFQLTQNIVDWGLEDTDLLTIRSRGTFARTLLPLDDDEKNQSILMTAGLCALALIVIIIVSVVRRRTLKPFPLEARSAAAQGAHS